MNRQMVSWRLIPVCIVLCLLYACHRPWYVREHSSSYYAVSADGGQDSGVLKLIRPYKIGVDTQMHVVIGRTAVPLSKAQPESTLGNLVADAQLEIVQRIDPGVQISVVNYGGIRIPYISPGTITKGKIFELMPFDNEIVIMNISGGLLDSFCQHMAAWGGWPVSGISFLLREKRADSIWVSGKLLDPEGSYKIVVSDYIAGGGDRCSFLEPLIPEKTGILLRDAIMEYIRVRERDNESLAPQLSGRIRYAE